MVGWLLAANAFGQQVTIACEPREDDRVVGVAPFEVQCGLEATEAVGWSRVTWLTGDGAQVTADGFTHVYERPGSYSVQATVEGLAYVAVDTGIPSDTVVLREEGYVTACAVPVPEFTYRHLGGLEYEMVNTSEFLVNCLDTIQWTVHRGDGRTESPVATFEIWDPRITLPDEGEYTVFLDLGGVAGTAAASLTIDATGGLPDALAGHPFYCSTGGVGLGGWLWLGIVGWWRRR